MKKTSLFAASAALLLIACGPGSTTGSTSSTGNASAGSVLGAIFSGNTVGNIIQSFIGSTTVKQADLIATWKYSTPGCAFSSQNTLAKAGGEAVAAEIKQKLAQPFQTVGISNSNTSITFAEDNTFSATIAGKTINGSYTFDEAEQKITLKTLLLSVNCYAKKNSDGIGVLFESSKLLTLFQTVAAFSNNKTLKTVSDLSKNYDGLRMGFDMKK